MRFAPVGALALATFWAGDACMLRTTPALAAPHGMVHPLGPRCLRRPPVGDEEEEGCELIVICLSSHVLTRRCAPSPASGALRCCRLVIYTEAAARSGPTGPATLVALLARQMCHVAVPIVPRSTKHRSSNCCSAHSSVFATGQHRNAPGCCAEAVVANGSAEGALCKPQC